MSRSTISRNFILSTALILSFLSVAWSQPSVQKVEPPNWWIGLPHDPMLMLTGDGLQQASVITHHKGLSVARTQSSPDGHYLFVWIRVAPKAAPGRAELKVSTASGSTSVALPLSHREKVAETAQGVHADDVLYLIMPDRFADGDASNNDPPHARGHYDRSAPKAYHGGDLKGIQQHLAYLKDLGVTALWLTPWWKNDSNAADYHGYHVTDFYGVDDHFGTLQELQQFVAAAHAVGIKVVSDYVANHTGPDHPWATRPPTDTWLHGSTAHHLEPKYDFWPLVDIHSDLRDRRPVVEGWFADKLPDLNPDDPLLAEYLADNAIWWMESAHFDAYRLDTFPYSSRRFWGGWHSTLHQCYPQLTTIGEVFNEDPNITSYFEGGRTMQGIDSGVTSVFDFPLYGALRSVLLRGEPVTKLVNVLQHDYLYQRPYGLYTFFGNHDIRRFMGEPNATVPKLNAAFSLLFTLRGIPEIYYGDELAMDGHDDPDNRHDFPGGFAGDPQNAFAAATRTPEQQQVFTHVQQLARLHREHPALQQGELTTIASSGNYFAFLRAQGTDRLLVVFNASSTEQTIELPRPDTPLATVNSISPLLDASSSYLEAEKLTLRVAPTSVAIYRVQ